jgi:selenoprotein W-related protein
VAEEILKEKKTDVGTLSLIPSSGGVFEVVADGKTIFSKKQTGRRPEPGEVITSLNGAR